MILNDQNEYFLPIYKFSLIKNHFLKEILIEKLFY